jgi:AraC-like DNA-binding protein
MYLKLVDILNSISMFQLVLFILFLVDRKKNRSSNKYLILFFTVQFLSISNHFIISQKAFFIEVSPHIFYIGSAFPFLWAPILYFYIKSLFYSDFHFKAIHNLHFLPFLLYFTYIFIEFHIKDTEEKHKIIIDNLLRNNGSVLFANITIAIQIIPYCVAMFIMLYNYKSLFKREQSNFDPNVITWIKLIIFGFFISYLIVNLCRIGLYTIPNQKALFVFISFFIFFIYYILLFYNATGHPELFKKIEEKPEQRNKQIPQNEAQQILIQLQAYMHQKKPYLNPDLSLKQLAVDMGINERLLSGVINQYKNQNFYDFVNNYRILKAKELLSGDQNKKKTVQEIFYDSGFNSKSSFNFAFKKYIGITPTEYKKQYSR